MSDGNLQARSRHIRFSSTVLETFSLYKPLTEGLVEAAQSFWKKMGLTIKSVQMPERRPSDDDLVIVEFIAEGGTIWTTNFESYKKTVTVTLSSSVEGTEVVVHLVLPGGLMSLQDREKAADLIDSFYGVMQSFKE